MLVEFPFPDEILSVLKTLSKIPFENLSKAVNVHIMKDAEQALMVNPEELLTRHIKEGSGGTCFSLTWFLINHLQKKGYSLYPVLCDRAYGKNTHCCAILTFGDKRYLLDPGYLAFKPIVLNPNRVSIVETIYNIIEVMPVSENRYVLSTIYRNEKKERFTIKDRAVTDSEYFKCWQETFCLESLTYPVVTLLKADGHYYFQKEHLYIRTKAGSERIHIPKSKQAESFAKIFGINYEVTSKALTVFCK